MITNKMDCKIPPVVRIFTPLRLPLLSLAAAVTITLSGGGCGYRIMGQYPLWPEGIRKVYVETIRNQTAEPELDKIMTEALVQEMWHQDAVQIVNRPQAQAILGGVITGYQADQPISFDRNRNIRQMRLTIHLDLQLEEVSTKKILWQEKGLTIQEEYQFFKDDLATTRSRKRQAQQKAAQDLAKRLLDGLSMGGIRPCS